jgi:hypothetical protein
MNKIMKSFPGVKTTVIVIVACLIIGVVVAGGFEPKALLGLAFAGVLLVMITIRNYDPDAFEAWNDPKAYSYRTQRDKVFRSLQALTKAVEEDSNIVTSSDVAARAVEARQVLDEVAGHYKARAR